MRKKIVINRKVCDIWWQHGISTLLDNNHSPTRTTTVLYDNEVRKEIPDSKGF